VCVCVCAIATKIYV